MDEVEDVAAASKVGPTVWPTPRVEPGWLLINLAMCPARNFPLFNPILFLKLIWPYRTTCPGPWGTSWTIIAVRSFGGPAPACDLGGPK